MQMVRQEPRGGGRRSLWRAITLRRYALKQRGTVRARVKRRRQGTWDTTTDTRMWETHAAIFTEAHGQAEIR